MTEAALSAIADRLLGAQNPDGGWPARAGGPSNTEATSLALLACGALPDGAGSAASERGLDWLERRQRDDGSFALTGDLPGSSWTTSLAVLALAGEAERRPAARHRARRGADWLLEEEGREPSWWVRLLRGAFPRERGRGLDPYLTGWPWTSGAFSWVEPTAYALIALKRLRPELEPERAAARIEEAEHMIYDRMCGGGGWNYGNSRVLGEDLWPYADSTAIALISLQDRRSHAANQQSVSALRRMLERNDSGLALGWSLLCLQLYGEQTSDLVVRLERSFEARGFLGETRALAVATLALAEGADRLRVGERA
jgi:hypothetical protein